MINSSFDNGYYLFMTKHRRQGKALGMWRKPAYHRALDKHAVY